jgi:hypothetical protein
VRATSQEIADRSFAPTTVVDGSERPKAETLARVARRIRLLIASTEGDVRLELEEIRGELDRLVGEGAKVIAIASRRTKR